VKIATVYPSARLLVVGSPTLQITGEGLQAGGQEQGMSVYGRENLAANSIMNVSVSGTAPPLQNAGNDAGGPTGQDAQQGSEPAQTVQQIPGRLDVLKWPLIAGFVGIFALGAMLLARKPVVAVAGVPGLPVSPASPSKMSPISIPSAGSPANGGSAMAQVDAAVGTSLDALKDQLFRLELRRQAGTISEQEYAAERAKAEKVLRDLVRG
jgi:hypothetical protein